MREGGKRCRSRGLGEKTFNAGICGTCTGYLQIAGGVMPIGTPQWARSLPQNPPLLTIIRFIKFQFDSDFSNTAPPRNITMYPQINLKLQELKNFGVTV